MNKFHSKIAHVVNQTVKKTLISNKTDHEILLYGEFNTNHSVETHIRQTDER